MGEFLQTPFFYFRCRECNFLFVAPFAGPEIYNEDYYRGLGADPFVDYATEYEDYRKTDRVLEFTDLVRIARTRLKTINAQSDAIAWLDFGCGAGGFLKFLRDEGTLKIGSKTLQLNLVGHDVGHWAHRLKEEDGLNILALPQLQELPDESFDVISMIEVLEHIPSPGEAIALVARLLKPGGLLLLTTGNLSCRVAQRDGLNFRYCKSEIHISLYDPKSLATVYRQAGLEPIQVRYQGVVAFKIVKSVRGKLKKALARWLVRLPFIVRRIDSAYGVSEMPCAIKPI